MYFSFLMKCSLCMTASIIILLTQSETQVTIFTEIFAQQKILVCLPPLVWAAIACLQFHICDEHLHYSKQQSLLSCSIEWSHQLSWYHFYLHNTTGSYICKRQIYCIYTSVNYIYSFMISGVCLSGKSYVTGFEKTQLPHTNTNI